MITELAHFPIDPSYGGGVYRRRLRFESGTNTVVAQIDDTHHAFWLTLDHDGRYVTAIDSGFLRAPTTACSGATHGLQALIGLAITAQAREVVARLTTGSGCTHLCDLACWALAHTDRPATWDITVPDQTDRPVWIQIARDGEMVHRWQIEGNRVASPASLAGEPLHRGFMRWASRVFEGTALMAATMLQRGLFVARARPYIVDQGPPMPLTRARGMAGACHAYSGERLAIATGSLGYVRDFTTGVRVEPLPSHIAAHLQDQSA